MSDMKCPFCQQELERQYDYNRDTLFHKCNKCYFRGDTILWLALIQAKQDLEQYEYKDNLQQQLNANNNQIQENYKQIVEIDEQIIENLEKDLHTAVKALKIVRRYTAINQFEPKTREAHFVARKALAQIEHKE